MVASPDWSVGLGRTAQLFFFRSELLAGDLAAPSGGAGGHAWLTRDELRAALPADYYAAVAPVLSS